MIKVDIVYGGYLYTSNGVASLLQLFKKYKNIFEEKQINIKIFSLENIFNKTKIVHAKANSKTMNNSSFMISLKNKSRLIAKKSSFFSIILFYRMFLLHGKRIAKYHISLQRNIDVLFFHDIFTCYFYLKLKKRNIPKTILVLHNNGDIFKMHLMYFPRIRNTFLYNYLLKIEKFVIKKVDKIGFVADNPRLNFVSINKKDKIEHKTFFVHNGIEEFNLEQAERLRCIKKETFNFKYRLCCVGSINGRKGQKIILESLMKLTPEERQQFYLSFIGEGAEKEALKKYVELNNVEEQVLFTGNVSNVDDYLAKSNIFILCSLDEGLPVSIIEAMRLGLPIISTPVAGIPEMVFPNINGILINPDINSLVNIFQNIDKYNWEDMGSMALKTFHEMFLIKKMIYKYSNIINALA